MPELEIVRFAYSDMGVFGSLFVDGQRLVSIERPWLNNQVSVSCIPEGTYRCVPRRYNRGGYDAVEVTDVPNRTHILFHKANTMHDLAGCIGVASRIGVLNRMWAGLDSKTAFGIFMDVYGDDEFDLTITRYVPDGM